MKIVNEPTVYHVMSRSALPDIEKDHLIGLIKKLSQIYFAEILGYVIMGTHFHILTRMHPESGFSNDEVVTRYKRFYGEDKEIMVS